MAHAAIRADLDQALDVERNLATEVALDLEAAIDELTKSVVLLFGQVAYSRVRIHIRLAQNLLGRRQANPEDVREGDLDPPLARNVDAGDACHRLPLPLLVFRVGANDHHGAVTANDLAVVAARLDGGSDFQRFLDSCVLADGARGYFRRYVIRPRVKSYGDSSTRTRSPGRIRMKFIRSLPLMWAKTLWPFSNSTANIVLGSGSMTVPSTSIASFLATGVGVPFLTMSAGPGGPTHERVAYQTRAIEAN